MDIERVLKELTLEEKAELCSGADFWHTQSIQRLGIPSVFMCDGPHGLRKQVKEADMMGIHESVLAICYPSASALAASFDRDVMKRLGKCLGEACQTENVSMLLGPGMNMKRSPLCGRNFEYFSEDPYLTGELSAAYVQSLQSQGVSACAKHFACNNQETRRMSGSSQVDERTLHEIYLPAFEKVVKKGKVRSIMCAYNAVNDIFCSENSLLLTEILRKKWGYKGFVVTDWGAVKDRVKGIRAGLDLEMPGGNNVQDEKIVEAVRSGELDEKILDQAVRNLLKFISDCQSKKRNDLPVDLEQAHQEAVNLESECAVLMKNEEDILPLKQEQKVVFIGEFANKPRYQGSGSSRVNAYRVTGAVQEVRKRGFDVKFAKGYSLETGGEDEEILLREALEKAKEADAAVIFVGLPDSYESEGTDRKTLDIPDNQSRLIREVANVQKNIVVVLHAGAPVAMVWGKEVKAILNMYLGGEGVGEAAVSLLYGNVNPSGKLAETYPHKLSDNPSYLNFPGENGIVTYHETLFIGYRYYDKKEMDVAYPFGYGLSYTTFEFHSFSVDKTQIYDTEQVKVRCLLKNTGKYTGKEVIQLYTGSVSDDVIRPVRELKEFSKIELQPNEEKQVEFSLDKRAFAYYSTAIHDWYVPTGDYRIEVGASSRDIRFCGIIHIESTAELPLYIRMSSTIGELMRHTKGEAYIRKTLRKMKGIPESADNDDDRVVKLNDLIESRIKEMPISSFLTFGLITGQEMKNLLDEVNQF